MSSPLRAMRLLARGALAAEATAERPLKAGATSRPEDVTAERASMPTTGMRSLMAVVKLLPVL